jgi:hypothetical protein
LVEIARRFFDSHQFRTSEWAQCDINTGTVIELKMLRARRAGPTNRI